MTFEMELNRREYLKAKQIAERMLKDNFSPEQIAKYTDLSVEEIKKLAEQSTTTL